MLSTLPHEMNKHRTGKLESPPAWVPSPDFIRTTNIAWLMQRAGVDSYEALHAWSAQNREAFWTLAIERLGLRFRSPCSRTMDLSQGVEDPHWLVDARLNIVESCFAAPAAAIGGTSEKSPFAAHRASGVWR